MLRQSASCNEIIGGPARVLKLAAGQGFSKDVAL